MSSLAFKDLAVSLMDDADAALLEQLSRDSFQENARLTDCEFIDRWRDWERTLRLNLARERAVKNKRQNTAAFTDEPPVVPSDAAQAAIKIVVGGESPLDKEILLDKARWAEIDNLAGNDYFHRNTVFAYYLKLVLLERKALFNADEGFDEYKSLYASILENAQYAGEPK